MQSPSAREYRWDYISTTDRTLAPTHEETHVAGQIHVHLAGLANQLEGINDILYVALRSRTYQQRH